MKSTSFAVLFLCLLGLAVSASARDMVLPAGTLLQCTMNEPNFSPSTVAVGDPVLCHLRSQLEFGQQAFPRGTYLVGRLESAQMPGHFWGKGNMRIQFDRIGLPGGDVPLDAKIVATHGYKVDRDGDIRGKGHAKRDIVEWMLPPLWPWKVIMLPARGPQPSLKGESVITMRLMDDVQVPQPTNYGPGWRSFGQAQNESYGYRRSAFADPRPAAVPQLAVRNVTAAGEPIIAPAPQVMTANYGPQPVADSGVVAQGFSTTSTVPVFVLKNGMVLEVGNYTYQDGRISYELAAGGDGLVTADQVNWDATTRANQQRGVRISLRGGHPAQGAPGY